MYRQRAITIFSMLALWMACMAPQARGGEMTGDPPGSEPVPVRFVYVHGTNLNTPESRSFFEKDVGRLHAEILKAFEASGTIRKALLRNGQCSLSPQPIAFFWGDRSQPEIEFLKRDLSLLQGVRTRLAGRARELMAFVLHDAVWFERPKNKYRIVKALHQTVMTTHGDDRQVVLFGHSAGSLVVFNYLVYLLPTLDQKTLLRLTKPPGEVARAIADADLPPTCALALIDSGAFRPDLSGRLISIYQEPELGIASLSAESRQLYLARLPETIRNATQTSCLPPGAIRGMVTFGSPLPVFESDVGRYEDTFSLLVSYTLKYMLENGMVWLHVNHVNDPVGFPMPGYNVMIARIKAIQGIEIAPMGGLIASKSIRHEGAALRNAHGWYWRHPKRFARELVKTYEESYAK